MANRTPLYDQHAAAGARMIDFGGWEMPVQYSGIIDEHTAVRTSAGLFDISHMGRFMISGRDAEVYLQCVLTCDVSRIEIGMSGYGLMCNEQGGIIDDVFVYRLPTEYLLVVNAANRQKDWDWLTSKTMSFDVELDDLSEKWVMLALQGPRAEELLCTAEGMRAESLISLPFHEISMYRFYGTGGLISRTGYTGEDGFEIFFDASRADYVWDALRNLGEPGSIKPCGLGARDSLRFEPCLALYGHEITEETNPYEARLGWVVAMDKGGFFFGRDALKAVKEAGVTRKLVGFEMVGRGIPRHGYPLQRVEGATIGHVTSGMHAPTLGKPLGLGYVPVELSKAGSEFDVLIRNQPVRARVVKTPFYKPRYKK